MMKSLLRFAALLLLASASMLAQAQLHITTDGVGSKRIPIAIATFADEGQSSEPISAIVKADLSRSGYFQIIDTDNPMSETSVVNYQDWKSKGAIALAVGSVQKLADGRFVIRYRLFDVSKGEQLSGFAETVYPDRLRLAAHKISDDIYEKLTGIPGDFSTRISYVTKEGRVYKLVVADADGKGEVDALRSAEPIISPVWSPDGSHIACVSFEKRKPIVFVVDLVHGEHHEVANFKGNNSAPAWSPDGSKLAVALTLTGNTQIYLIPASGGGAAASDLLQRHRHRAALLARRPEHLLHQQPRRRPADLQGRRGRRQRAARDLQRRLQHQPAHLTGRQEPGLRLAAQRPIPDLSAGFGNQSRVAPVQRQHG